MGGFGCLGGTVGSAFGGLKEPEQLGASKPVLAQHFVLGGLRILSVHFGRLLEKLLFLGRTLLLRLWVLGTHVRKRLGRRLARRWLVETAWAAWEARSEARGPCSF